MVPLTSFPGLMGREVGKGFSLQHGLYFQKPRFPLSSRHPSQNPTKSTVLFLLSIQTHQTMDRMPPHIRLARYGGEKSCPPLQSDTRIHTAGVI